MQPLFTSSHNYAPQRRLFTLFIGLLWLVALSAGHAEPDAAHPLTGRVLTPEHQPASGAVVTLLLFDGGGCHPQYARADAEGAFRFEQVSGAAEGRRALQVLAQKPGSGLGWTDADRDDNNVEIYLNRPS